MTREERAGKLESYAAAHAQLVNKLQDVPHACWAWKPGPGRWSVHEVIVHLADAEAHGFIRGRAAVAEPGCRIAPYDQDRWAEELLYREQDTAEALELFRLLRKTTYGLLSRLPESVWSRTITHPERGVMTLDDWLDLYEEHTKIHLRQIERNCEAWHRASGAP